MSHGTERTQDAGIPDKHIQPFEPFINRRAEFIDIIEFGEIHRRECGRAAGCPNLIIDLLQTALRAGHEDHVRAFGGKAPGHGRTDTA